MSDRNVTLRMPEDIVRLAKVHAAERDISMSALVRDLLVEALGGADYDAVWAEEEARMRAGALQVGPVTWTRGDLHDR